MGLLVFGMAEMVSASLITNDSFELGNFTDSYGNGMSLPVGSTQITGWTVVNAETAWLNTPNIWGLAASDGAFFLDLTGYHNSSPYGGVSQTITTTIGQQYTLSLDLGTGQPNQWVTGPISVVASAGSTSRSFTLDPGSQWQTFSFDFTADAAITPVTIIGTVGYQYIGLDNVSIDANPVPIPATLLLLGSGIGALAGTRIRKKNK